MAARKRDIIEQLIPEIIWYILDTLRNDKSGLAPCSTISPVWQHAVESRSFASIRLESTASVSTFRDAFASGTHVRTYLRDLLLNMHLPMRCGSKQGRVKNQLVFGQTVRLLLDVLTEWGDIGGNVPSSDLSLTIQPLYDSVGFYDDQYNKSSLRKVDFGPSKLLLERKFLALWSEYQPAVVLSPLPCVKRFTVSNSKDFVLSPRTLCAMPGAFTRLEHLSLDFCDPSPKRRDFTKRYTSTNFLSPFHASKGICQWAGVPVWKAALLEEANHPTFSGQWIPHYRPQLSLSGPYGRSRRGPALRGYSKTGTTDRDRFNHRWTGPRANGTWYVTGAREDDDNDTRQAATAEPAYASSRKTKGEAVDDWSDGDGRKAYLANGQ
ncbi:hypothetical protein PG996_004419 [Apiospora saccharicola]|uniref:F-box domain-containing protein n=1 Tax=Apiospora saccharicola TaxID=335842 RepID=A0ABR1W437_9PEZI